MSNFVDARGLACPEPVICTKKALEELQTGTLTTIVDNDVARDNVARLAKSFDYPVEIEEKENLFYIKISKNKELVKALNESGNTAFLITSEFMGQGNDELGKILMKSFFFTLTETSSLPKVILFINSGVFLTCEGSHVLKDVMELEKKGVEIISCGTCLDYYKIKEKLCVGSISNMYTIVDQMINNKTISI